MRDKQFLKKYMRGYMVAGALSVLFLVVTSFGGYLMSRSYKNALSELTAMNNLELAVNDLNDSVNVVCLWFTKRGLASYEENRETVRKYLTETERQVKRHYIREVVDANNTVETYLEKSDRLIEEFSQYLNGDGREDTRIYSSQYEELQTLYSYILSGFQSAYSVRLDSLRKAEQDLLRAQQMIMWGQTFILILVLGVSLSYMFHLVRQTSKSISAMMEGVQQMREDIFQAEPIRIESNDEFEKFAETFNRMAEIIRAQMQKIVENADVKEQLAEMEIENLRMFGELQKSNLNFLQSRVNPHFLFNTLNMISSLVGLEQIEKSKELIAHTASFLRYNLDNITKEVTLSKELENLKEYVEIQKCRYEERYRYFFDIEKECEGFQMPCMILQPLVENSILHGMAMKIDGGSVWITAKKAGDGLMLEVRDDGEGMTQEQIENVYQDIYEQHMSGSHIGIGNIYRRLQLFYQNEVEIEIKDMAPGLRIRLFLPCGGVSEWHLR